MSAYVVSDLTINAIVTWAIQHGAWVVQPGHDSGGGPITPAEGQRWAECLYRANVASVNHRYAHHGQPESAEGFVYRPDPRQRTAAVIAQQCACLEYQSCEPRDWIGSPAWHFLTAVRAALCRHLPGYEAAPWGLGE